MKKSSVVFGLLLGVTLATPRVSHAQYNQACASAVQGKIAWDEKGTRQWNPANIEKLCKGGVGDQAARCFQHVMHSGSVNWGGGTKWEWANAIDLCTGSPDEHLTVACFNREMAARVPWKQAIAKCANLPPPQMADPIALCKETLSRVAAGLRDAPWSPADQDRICRGGVGDQPARCYEHVMRGTVNWGGGTKWERENAINLCKASPNEHTTIECFDREMAARVPWQQAIPKCGGGGGQVAMPPPAPPPVDQMAVCRNAVQGRIPWNSSGDKNWAPANIENLCRGGNMDEPARCFERLMQGNINWGGGTKWEWENAVNLCRGVQNAASTISCFEGQIRGGIQWKAAIPNCNRH